jgi:hypothetical protein
MTHNIFCAGVNYNLITDQTKGFGASGIPLVSKIAVAPASGKVKVIV